MMGHGIIVGGCVYRSMVRAEHAASLATFAALASLENARRKGRAPYIAGFDYQHTSNLPQGRAQWLRRCIADRNAMLAISIDSDTAFEAGDLLLDIERVSGSVAIGVVPIRIGGTDLCNINITVDDEQKGRSERRAFASELASVLEGDRLIASGGFGLAVFNLHWFRACWPEPHPEGIDMDTGEDIAMCRSVRQRGGMVVALRVRSVHHEYKA